MTKNGTRQIRSAKTRKLTLAVAIGLLTGSLSASAAGQPDSFCQSAGEKNAYDCAKAEIFQAKQSDIDAKLQELNRWMADEQQSQRTTLAKPDQPESDKLREKIQFNAKLLASELKQAKKLQSKGDLKGAFNRVNDYLVSNPKDPNGWLLYGISLINQNKLDEAADIFSKLIHLYPDSPEPYNNLAVVYARKGDNEKAVDTLLKAFETHPSYAQVQTNLKAVYATLATQAYNRALNLDNGNKTPRADLGVLDQVYQPVAPQTMLAAATPVATLPPQTVAAAEVAVATPPGTSDQLVIEERDQSTGIVPSPQDTAPAAESHTTDLAANDKEPAAENTDVAAETTKAEVAEVKPAAGPVLNEAVKAEILKVITNWAASWAAKDVPAYLDFYTEEYTPGADITHKQWVWGRQVRLNKPAFIKVDISDISLAEAGDGKVRSVFLQKYQSDTYQDEVYKTLTLTQENGHWKISTETTL
ncbi:L,D-transpeptidase Cds6 family protein [Amphritea sp.]|uniref:L,D-transpeptidase Cds6 family protein n=1 Tax=Amphritea sp. TaxID=1872502 RepID=UPI003D0DF8CA